MSIRRVLSAATIALALLRVSSTVGAAPCWRPPVDAEITERFQAPPCPYCAGHRGVEFTLGIDVPVRAVASGVITWAGSVAGTRYVVVEHADGRRATYGQLGAIAVRRGETVLVGRVVGRAHEALYFGVREGERYVDPERFMGELISVRRLVPVDGRAPRRAPSPRLVCRSVPVVASVR
jgi:murein DD-endopeptidase MepM/ murein hydrolase activator NlpD